MSYIQKIDKELTPFIDKKLNKTVVDLFAGCGGLSLGFESEGFKTIGYEMLEDAVATYNKNLLGECFNEMLTTSTTYPSADIVIGGPPCQPFSVGGKQLGLEDSRDGFPIFIAAVEQIQPEVFLFENVRGMLYKNLWYLKEVIGKLESLGYQISYELLNAKHYGVPQNRERVIVIGSKYGINFPQKAKKLVSAGEALDELAEHFDEDSKFLTPSMDKYVAKYEKASSCVNPRDLHLHQPARTLTCRNLAGSTGDMQRVKLPDGRRRRLTHREAARLQSFPDWFEFVGGETSVFNQIGNAVAPYFAKAIAKEIKSYFLHHTEGKAYRFVDSDNQLKLFNEPSKIY